MCISTVTRNWWGGRLAEMKTIAVVVILSLAAALPSAYAGEKHVMSQSKKPAAKNTVTGPSNIQGNLDQMSDNNMMFLATQTKVQNISQQTQTASNISKADSDAKSNAVRNMRS